MAQLSWKARITVILIVSSVILVGLHVLFFKDAPTLFFYLALDIVFVPIQVLLVTVIIERLLSERERQALIQRLNILIGTFFNEAGGALMGLMASSCVDFETLRENLTVDGRWDKNDYRSAERFIENHECRFDSERIPLEELKDFLASKRQFILGLLQNPSIIEHERFTDLLWALSHLSEELLVRPNLRDLPKPDMRHLESDIQRAFGLLIREWLSYMRRLKESYPYIYSLSLRTNPLNPDATPILQS